MTRTRAIPFLILIALVAGITVAFLAAPMPQEEGARQSGPLAALSPALRTLAAGPGTSEDAAVLVGRTMEQVVEDPRPVILEALSSSDWTLQWAGLLALPRYGESDAALGGALLPLLASRQLLVRKGAAHGASYLRDQEFRSALEGLIPLLEDLEAGVRAAALGTIGRRAARYPELVPAFARALSDLDGTCRSHAARALAQVELQEKVEAEELGPLCEDLMTALSDKIADVRIYAVMALGRAGSAAAVAVPDLLALLESEDPLLRGQAATALGSIGPAALPGLQSALENDSGERAPSLLWALRLMGAPGRLTMRKALKHASSMVRVLAAQQLWEIDDTDSAPVSLIGKEAEGEDLATQLVAIRVLGRMGTEAAEALPALIRLQGHSDQRVAEAAGRAHERISSQGGD